MYGKRDGIRVNMMQAERRQPRTGFTLVEALVASSLAVLMIGIVAGMVPRFTARLNSAANERQATVWRNQFSRQLQSEYLHCQSVVVERSRIQIETLVQLDPTTGQIAHAPCRIVYLVSLTNPPFVIKRTEFLSGSLAGERISELACIGVDGFQLATEPQTDVPPGVTVLRVSCRGSGNDTGRDSFEVVLFHHGSPEQ